MQITRSRTHGIGIGLHACSHDYIIQGRSIMCQQAFITRDGASRLTFSSLRADAGIYILGWVVCESPPGSSFSCSEKATIGRGGVDCQALRKSSPHACTLDESPSLQPLEALGWHAMCRRPTPWRVVACRSGSCKGRESSFWWRVSPGMHYAHHKYWQLPTDTNASLRSVR